MGFNGGAFAGGIVKGVKEGEEAQYINTKRAILDLEHKTNLAYQEDMKSLAQKYFGNSSADQTPVDQSKLLDTPASVAAAEAPQGAIPAPATPSPAPAEPMSAEPVKSAMPVPEAPKAAIPAAEGEAQPAAPTPAAIAPAASPAAAAIPVKTDGPAAPQAASQKVDLRSPEMQAKLFDMNQELIGLQVKHGKITPEQLQKYQEFGIKMRNDGTAEAFRKLVLTGDDTDLVKHYGQHGVTGMKVTFGNDENGYPQQIVTATLKDGSAKTMPASVIAAAFHAADLGTMMHTVKKDDITIKQEERRAKQAALKLEQDERRLQQGDRKLDLLDKRISATVGNKDAKTAKDEAKATQKEIDSYVKDFKVTIPGLQKKPGSKEEAVDGSGKILYRQLLTAGVGKGQSVGEASDTASSFITKLNARTQANLVAAGKRRYSQSEFEAERSKILSSLRNGQ